MACDMPEPCKLLSLDSCQKKFLLTHKEVDLALHPVFGLVLQLGDMEKFPHAHDFESLDPFFSFVCFFSKKSPPFTAVEEDGGLVYNSEQNIQLL